MSRFALAVTYVAGMMDQAWAGFDEGMEAFNRGDYETAFNELVEFAERCHPMVPMAQHLFGNLYGDGKGVPQDYAEADRWYSNADSIPDASFQFGLLHAEGKGVRKDSFKAFIAFEFATRAGHDEARVWRDKMKAKLTEFQVKSALLE